MPANDLNSKLADVKLRYEQGKKKGYDQNALNALSGIASDLRKQGADEGSANQQVYGQSTGYYEGWNPSGGGGYNRALDVAQHTGPQAAGYDPRQNPGYTSSMMNMMNTLQRPAPISSPGYYNPGAAATPALSNFVQQARQEIDPMKANQEATVNQQYAKLAQTIAPMLARQHGAGQVSGGLRTAQEKDIAERQTNALTGIANEAESKVMSIARALMSEAQQRDMQERQMAMQAWQAGAGMDMQAQMANQQGDFNWLTMLTNTAQAEDRARQFATQMGYNYDALSQNEQQDLRNYAMQQKQMEQQGSQWQQSFDETKRSNLAQEGIARTNASRPTGGSGGSGYNAAQVDDLFKVWQVTGKAPNGLQSLGVQPGAPFTQQVKDHQADLVSDTNMLINEIYSQDPTYRVQYGKDKLSAISAKNKAGIIPDWYAESLSTIIYSSIPALAPKTTMASTRPQQQERNWGSNPYIPSNAPEGWLPP